MLPDAHMSEARDMIEVPEVLRVGDHIYHWGSPFQVHHGLVLQILEASTLAEDKSGEDSLLDRIIVLNLAFDCADGNGAKVQRVPLRSFLNLGWKGWEGSLRLARYNVSWAEHAVKWPGTCYPFADDPPEAAVQRGEALLQVSECRPHDLHSLMLADCEHVIVWCKTGRWKNQQVDSVLGIARMVALIACAVAACRKPGSRFLPFLGGVILWRVSQQDLTLGDCGGGPPPFLLKEGADLSPQNGDSSPVRAVVEVPEQSNLTSEADGGNYVTSAARQGQATQAGDDADVMVDDYVVVEDMRASSGFIVCGSAQPNQVRSARAGA